MAIRHSCRNRSLRNLYVFNRFRSLSDPVRVERRGLAVLKRLTGPVRVMLSHRTPLDRRETAPGHLVPPVLRATRDCAFFATPARPARLTRGISSGLTRAPAGYQNVPRWRKDAPVAWDRRFRAFHAHLYSLALRLGARPRHLSTGILILQRDQGLCTCVL